MKENSDTVRGKDRPWKGASSLKRFTIPFPLHLYIHLRDNYKVESFHMLLPVKDTMDHHLIQDQQVLQKGQCIAPGLKFETHLDFDLLMTSLCGRGGSAAID